MGDAADEAVWSLVLSDTTKASLAEIETWSLTQIARALVVAEAVSENERWARIKAEHDLAARR